MNEYSVDELMDLFYNTWAEKNSLSVEEAASVIDDLLKSDPSPECCQDQPVGGPPAQ